MNSIPDQLDACEDPSRLDLPPGDTPNTDMRSVVHTALGFVAPLHIFLLGPLTIGVLAVLSSRNTDWNTRPAVQRDILYGYSETVSVPPGLTSSSAVRIPQSHEDPTTAPKFDSPALHAFPKRADTLQLRKIGLDLPPLPPIIISADPTPAPVPIRPSAPRSFSIQR